MKEKGGKNGKKKRNADKDSEGGKERKVSSEAMRGVFAILCVAFSGFLILANLGGGGALGAKLFSGLSWFLGVGYLLLPLSLILLAILIFRSFEKHFGWIQVVSMSIFLLSGLGMINLAFPSRGGLLGAAVSSPLVATVDTIATVIFLIAFILISLVIAFDLNIGELFAKLRAKRGDEADEAEQKKQRPIESVPITGLSASDIEEEDEKNEKALTEAKQQKAPKEPSVTTFQKQDKSEAAEGFPIIAATGSTYTPPPISILAKNRGKPEVGDVKANMNQIKRTLQNFGIEVEMDEAVIGPTVTRYAMKPAEGVRLSKIVALQSNLELALQASPIRIEAPIPGKALVGIEVPNTSRTTLGLAPLLTDDIYVGSGKPLMMALGRTITGQPLFADLAKMPHMLVAGTTGSGKSVMMNDFVVSLLYRCGPERLRFIMVDPKRVELTLYNTIPHLLTPVITDPKKAILAMKWLTKEMERRYNILETERVRDIASYHEKVVGPALEKERSEDEPMPEAMPYIVVMIDELADIMATYPRELEGSIVRLAQMSRAVGIHLVLATQRPSVKVITGLIKANIPARVAFQVASQIDSRTILDGSGAEKLLGAGDMLFLSGEMSKPSRIQAPYISEDEVKKVVTFIAKNSTELVSEINFEEKGQQAGGTDAIFASMADEGEDDDLYPEAKRTVIEAGKASTSYLQRKLGIGYARAAKLIDILEERGVIGPADGAKPREVIGAGNADELASAPVGEEEGTEGDERQ